MHDLDSVPFQRDILDAIEILSDSSAFFVAIFKANWASDSEAFTFEIRILRFKIWSSKLLI